MIEAEITSLSQQRLAIYAEEIVFVNEAESNNLQGLNDLFGASNNITMVSCAKICQAKCTCKGSAGAWALSAIFLWTARHLMKVINELVLSEVTM